MLVGNDVSQFQNAIDWDTYKNNANFVIIRSTYGNGYYDSWFAHNRDEARRVGLPLGFYHYCYPQLNSPQAEAAWFCKAVYDLKEGESLYLDFEESGNDIVGWCKAFLDYVSANFNGIKPLMYLNQSHMSLDWSSVVNAGYGLWLASYQADGVGNTGKWPLMALQQTSSSQTVPGIAGNVDRDVFFGDINAFKAYGYKKPIVLPTPTQTTTTTQPTAPQTASTISSTPVVVSTNQTPPVIITTIAKNPLPTPHKDWLDRLINFLLSWLPKNKK